MMFSLYFMVAVLIAVTAVTGSPLHNFRLVKSASGLGAASENFGPFWNGFQNVEKLFTFGDSYTTTGFVPTGEQPSPPNPLGNPPYPGYTSANGPNWADFLTTTYNQSLLETYNLAYGGAVVDSSLVTPYLPTVLDLIQQINNEFIPTYVTNNVAGWTSSNSLFAIWIGINDVGGSYFQKNASLNPAIINVYSSLIDQVVPHPPAHPPSTTNLSTPKLYNSGARNLLFLNVPAVNLAPMIVSRGPADIDFDGAAIADFNGRVVTLASDVKSRYPDTTIFQFDTNAVFSQVMADPAAYPETAGYRNTTQYCEAYQNGTPAPDHFDARCGVPVNQYLWLNALHPTYPMQAVVASQIARMLGR